MADSSIAILLMCLEQLATRYLAERGDSIRHETPLQSKLNSCNRDLRCFSKDFLKSLDQVRTRLRNPLFHAGASGEPSLDELLKWEMRLRNGCVVFLCAISGYRGPVLLWEVTHPFVETVAK